MEYHEVMHHCYTMIVECNRVVLSHHVDLFEALN